MSIAFAIFPKKIFSETGFFVFPQKSKAVFIKKKSESPFLIYFFKATPHKDGAADAPSNFLSDWLETAQTYGRMVRSFCAR